jgi:flagellar basal body-associated protein FliL
MEEIGNNNPATNDGSVPSESFANIPAPTAEVKVRTMKSDLASLAATGGGMPQFNKVNVEGLSISKTGRIVPGSKKNNKSILVLLIVLVALAVLAAVIWLGYSLFFKGSPAQQSGNQSNSNSGTVAIQTYQSPAITAGSVPFVHVSLFREPADSTVTFSLPQSGAETANDLQTYDQRVLTVLSAVDKKANFVEIKAKDADGNDVSIEELLSLADAGILDSNFLAAHFNPDATFFAYRDQTGFWPGYVLALRPGENQLSLKSGVKAIESSTKIGNIFLTDAGVASPSGFTDAVIANATVRVLNFTGAKSASFVYGWFQSYLIISASQSGFAQAVAHLQ